MRRLLLLRPEPGLAASAERAEALGLDVVRCPLFRVEPIEWVVPDPTPYDALLFTSANAVKLGGAGLDRLRRLPVHAVGAATASAAAQAGFEVVNIGEDGIERLLAPLPASIRLLHLAGEHRVMPEHEGHVDSMTVYRSAKILDPNLPDLDGMVVAVHSPRAGVRLAELAIKRARTAVATISGNAATGCGSGWERIEIADRPDDASLLALAAMLCHTSPPA